MEDTHPAESRKNSFLEYALVTVIFIFVVLIGRFVYQGWRDGQEEALFKTQVPALVIASENLIAVAAASADPGAFRNQLAEVKAQYNAIQAWPLKHTQANLEYVQAIEGWSIAAGVLDVKAAQNSEYAYQNILDLERISAYLGIDKSKLAFFTASDLIRQLLYDAEEHAQKGRYALGY